MKLILLFAVLLAGGVAMPLPTLAGCDPHPTTLAAMQDCYRPLLVFAQPGADAALSGQVEVLASHAEQFRSRDMLLVVVPNPGRGRGIHSDYPVPAATLAAPDAALARDRFNSNGSFQVVLLGKDGGEKLRSGQPIPFKKLASLIDSMPMRQREMHSHN